MTIYHICPITLHFDVLSVSHNYYTRKTKCENWGEITNHPFPISPSFLSPTISFSLLPRIRSGEQNRDSRGSQWRFLWWGVCTNLHRPIGLCRTWGCHSQLRRQGGCGLVSVFTSGICIWQLWERSGSEMPWYVIGSLSIDGCIIMSAVQDAKSLNSTFA